MTTKHIKKTTKEYTYDEKGFILKEVITEEYYEEEVHTSGIVEAGVTTTEEILKNIKKAQGVPCTSGTKPFVQPYTTQAMFGQQNIQGVVTTTCNNVAKADTNGITHNTTINVNATKPPTEKELQETVKKALKTVEKLKYTSGFKF